MISRIHTRWLRIGIALPVIIGLIGGLTWALRPRTEPETAQLARRELQEAIRQLDLFLQIYPATPDEAQGALERARSAFEKAAGHLALSQASGVRQRQTDFHQLQDLTAARAAPEVVLPLARQLREALQRMLEP